MTKRFFGTDCSNRQEKRFALWHRGTVPIAICRFAVLELMEISLGTRPSPTEKEAPTQQLEITASYKQNADNRSETINPGIGRVLKLVVYLY